MGKYVATCGRLCNESDTPSYIATWWACACGVAQNKGICATIWYWWWNAVIGDVKTVEGSFGWFGQTRQQQNGNYVQIWMGYPEIYLGQFKWVCETLCQWINSKGSPTGLDPLEVYEIIDSFVFNRSPPGFSFVPTIVNVMGVIDYYLGFDGDAKTGCDYY